MLHKFKKLFVAAKEIFAAPKVKEIPTLTSLRPSALQQEQEARFKKIMSRPAFARDYMSENHINLLKGRLEPLDEIEKGLRQLEYTYRSVNGKNIDYSIHSGLQGIGSQIKALGNTINSIRKEVVAPDLNEQIYRTRNFVIPALFPHKANKTII